MPARQKMTPIELMIVFAILGILASITIPSMNQAQRRAQHARHAVREYAAPGGAVPSDGQLNTIQVSKLSQSAGRANPFRWISLLVGFVPIIISISVAAVIFSRFRHEMTRRRAQ